MGQVIALLNVVTGFFIAGLTHYGIAAGRLYGRWSSVIDRVDDPSMFWFIAAGYYGIGITMIIYGTVYTLTGTAIFPDLKEHAWFGYILVLMVAIVGAVCWKLLPFWYR